MSRTLYASECERCGIAFLSIKRTARYCSQKCHYASCPSIPPEVRFWAKVNQADGCWLWTAANDGRYGKFGVGTRRKPAPMNHAHRIAWIFTNGPIPDGMNVCHHCDVPLCVRPDHLFLGTQSDNLKDMGRKGRHYTQVRGQYKGEEASNAKFSNSIIAEIRRRNALGESGHKLSRRFGVSLTHMGRILRMESRKHG